MRRQLYCPCRWDDRRLSLSLSKSSAAYKVSNKDVCVVCVFVDFHANLRTSKVPSHLVLYSYYTVPVCFLLYLDAIVEVQSWKYCTQFLVLRGQSTKVVFTLTYDLYCSSLNFLNKHNILGIFDEAMLLGVIPPYVGYFFSTIKDIPRTCNKTNQNIVTFYS